MTSIVLSGEEVTLDLVTASLCSAGRVDEALCRPEESCRRRFLTLR